MMSAVEPSQAPAFLSRDAGTTSATGWPKRVMRSGCFVLRTCSSKAEHLALNSEIATVCISFSSGRGLYR